MLRFRRGWLFDDQRKVFVYYLYSLLSHVCRQPYSLGSTRNKLFFFITIVYHVV